MIPVDGAVLHVLVEGQGIPAVVLLPGTSCSHLAWELVAGELRDSVRVVRYDRPGLGFSPYLRCDRGPRATAVQLRSLLTAAEVPPPYVLVGHSLGALHVRAYAALFPEAVAGVVLVDPSDEHTALFRRSPGRDMVAKVLPAALPFGLARALGFAGRVPLRRNLAYPDHPDVAACLGAEEALTLRTVHGWRGMIDDNASLDEFRREFMALTEGSGFPSVPLTVISASNSSLNPEEQARREHLRGRLHARIAARSPLGRHVVAQGSGHMVPWDSPEVIVAQVRSMLKSLSG